MNAVCQIERKLYDENVLSLPDLAQETELTIENKSMIQFEATLLDMVSIPDLCQGVQYIFTVKLIDKYIVI